MQRADAGSGLYRNDRPLFCAGDPIRLVEGPLTSPFEKWGLRGIFIFDVSQIPPAPLFKGGNNSALRIVKRHKQ